MNKKEVKEFLAEEFQGTINTEVGEYLEACPMWVKDELWRVRMNTRNKEHYIVRSKFLHVDFEDPNDIQIRDKTINENKRGLKCW